MKAYIFMDANLALHYRRPEEIDWKVRTESTEVYLISTPTFTTELEREKVHNPSEKLRERADKYLRSLRSYIRDCTKPLRDSVYWYCIANEPRCNFETHELRADVHDDWLIAHALEFDPGIDGQVFFATNDTTLLMKVEHRGFATVPIYDEDALPAAPDPAQKQVQQLRQRLAKYEARLPDVRLAPSDGSSFTAFHIPERLPPSDALSFDQIKRQHPKIDPETRASRTGGSHGGDIAKIAQQMRNVSVPPNRIERYNENLDAYYQAYADYLERLENWRERVRLTEEVRLSLNNDGTAPVTDVDVFLDLPEDLVLYAPHDFPNRPEAPESPRRPGSGIADINSTSGPLTHPGLHPLFPQPVMEADGDPVVHSERNRVTVRVRNLKHGHTCVFDPFLVSFEEAEKVRSFSINYTITAHELPEPIEGSLNVAIKTDSVG